MLRARVPTAIVSIATLDHAPDDMTVPPKLRLVYSQNSRKVAFLGDTKESAATVVKTSSSLSVAAAAPNGCPVPGHPGETKNEIQYH
eukprot:1675246-Amphidinium_carterae.1